MSCGERERERRSESRSIIEIDIGGMSAVWMFSLWWRYSIPSIVFSYHSSNHSSSSSSSSYSHVLTHTNLVLEFSAQHSQSFLLFLFIIILMIEKSMAEGNASDSWAEWQDQREITFPISPLRFFFLSLSLLVFVLNFSLSLTQRDVIFLKSHYLWKNNCCKFFFLLSPQVEIWERSGGTPPPTV